jgi:hypothetical protein
MIAAAQKVEHYEISAYGTLRHIATLLGHKDHRTILADTLKEEKNADKLLNKIATKRVNPDAKAKTRGAAAGKPARKSKSSGAGRTTKSSARKKSTGGRKTSARAKKK